MLVWNDRTRSLARWTAASALLFVCSVAIEFLGEGFVDGHPIIGAVLLPAFGLGQLGFLVFSILLAEGLGSNKTLWARACRIASALLLVAWTGLLLASVGMSLEGYAGALDRRMIGPLLGIPILMIVPGWLGFRPSVKSS